MTNVVLLSPNPLHFQQQTMSEARQEAEQATAEREGGGGDDESVATTQEQATDQCRWFNSGMTLGVDWTARYKGEGNDDDESGGRGSEYKGTGFE